jgi:signal transduction histidine kinase
MLHKFLTQNEKSILELAVQKTRDLSDSKPSSDLLEGGLPIFLRDLIKLLKIVPIDGIKSETVKEKVIHSVASGHGKESYRLGYTVSQVVHGYGAICQSITELATREKFDISAWEFRELNLSLDVAIADAVTMFEETGQKKSHQQEVLRLGSLAHELRNTLSSISIAHEMISRGSVGVGGNTSKLLSKSIARMGSLIDRSLAEVRMQGEPTAELNIIRLIDAISEVEATSVSEASNRGLSLAIDVNPTIEINVDSQLFISALSNLVHNALKFSKVGGTITLRSRENDEHVIIEVEDECGGLPEGMAEDLFKPYIQKNENKSGIGLGLTISRRAIILNKGTLSVRNFPGKGCIFAITLPKVSELTNLAV